MRKRDIFIQSLQIDDSDKRSKYLDSACEGDSTLRDRVLQLLAGHEKQESFLLDSPPPGVTDPTIAPPTDEKPHEKPGTLIGPYRLLLQIGEGGFGSSTWPNNMTGPSKSGREDHQAGNGHQRGGGEVRSGTQALALMDHPNIARFLTRNDRPGRPYFVMDLVRGVPITEYCDRTIAAQPNDSGCFSPSAMPFSTPIKKPSSTVISSRIMYWLRLTTDRWSR